MIWDDIVFYGLDALHVYEVKQTCSLDKTGWRIHQSILQHPLRAVEGD